MKSKSGNVERALYQGLGVSGVLAALIFIPVTRWLMNGITIKGAAAGPHWWRSYSCSLIGLGVTAPLFFITDFTPPPASRRSRTPPGLGDR